MQLEILKALLQNATVLVVAFFFLTRLNRWKVSKSNTTNILTHGFTYALCGLLALGFSFQIETGIFIDMRVPILVIASFFGGFYIALIAALPIIFLRFVLGGDGLYAGLGVILSAIVFGLILRKLKKNKKLTFGIPAQALMGVVSSLIYLFWMLLLPSNNIAEISKAVSGSMFIVSIITFWLIFYIRKRESQHQELLLQLNEVNNLFNELAIDSNIGILILKNREIKYINSPLLKKCGFKYFDIENNDFYSFITDTTIVQFNKLLEKLNSGAFSESIPIEITLVNGTSFTQLIHAKPLKYKGEQTILFVAVDITKLSDTEKTLQSKLDQLELTLNAFGAVVWKANIMEDTLIADKDFYDLLAYSPPANPPKFSHWLIEMGLNKELYSGFNKLKSGETQALSGEINYAGDHLTEKWFNIGVKTSSFSNNGEAEELSGILFDTTLLKEKEINHFNETVENIQSQKMEAVGRLAGGIAHDFNNILHVIMGYSEILTKISENDRVYSDLCKPIIAASKKGSELVKQLLIFSRDEKAKLQSINLTELVINFTKLLSRIMEQNIVIAASINTENTYIYGDSVQIDQILMNLCVNARDAMPSGGKISITLDEVVIGNDTKTNTGTITPGTYACLSILDEGTGIPENIQKEIFEPFFTTKKPDKGTGLGLATVLGIVKDHSGYINLKNLPTKGLEFKIYLPKLRQDYVQQSFPPEDTNSLLPKNPQIPPICVLLAEDSPEIMKLTIEGLGASGMRTIRASNGKEAIELYKTYKDQIDMLVFDVIMPELDGPSAYMEIKKLGCTKPILFATGYHGNKLSTLKQNFEIINKPYTISSLASKIQKQIRDNNEK